MLTELVALPGGVYRMGSIDFYPEEAPIHTVVVAPFSIERHPVTNAQFAEFVAATGYLTVAEQPVEFADAEPGALVFTPTAGPVDLRDWRQWWSWVPGATWRTPHGPGSDVTGKADHPVVQVAYPDAGAYAAWAGRRLATEAEWEYAARAGVGSVYAWGDEEKPDGRPMANTWQGAFPYRNEGFGDTSPVGAFEPNGFGLSDMIGNVWEWTTTEFAGHHRLDAPPKPCCTPTGPANPAVMQTLKGGSHLCAPEYCHRYRPAARSPQSQDTATSHIGFRCAADG